MRAAFAIAALAGSVIAAPSYGQHQPGNKDVKYVEHVEVVTVINTVYVTEGQEQPTAAPQPAYQAPAVTTVVYEAKPKPTSPAYQAPAYTPAPQPEKPKPTPTPSPSPAPAPAPAPSTGGYMGVVNEWRAKMGMKALVQDDKLQSNAQDTVNASHGTMVHKLNAGTFAQVLAPMDGSLDDTTKFTHVFVGGWLCEKPNLPGLNGVCQQQSQGWTYEGQTGHADILTSDAYSKIGCAISDGICGCDLA